MNVLSRFCYISYIVDKIKCHLIQTRARHIASKNIVIYFFYLNYEDRVNFIGTDFSNLMGSSILVSYFFSFLSVLALLYPGYIKL